MGKSSLSPQSRKVLYSIIGIALLIGAVLIIASVGQQLTTIMSSGNATQTAQIDLEETALATDALTQFPITNPTIQSDASPTSARPSATRQPEMNVPTQPSGNNGSLTETAIAIPIILSTITPSLNLTRYPIGGAFPTPENVTILEVAETTNVQVIDQSGAVIGTGLLRVYYASNVSPQNTTRVELELRFVEKFITATPFSDVTRIPVTPVTSTPQPMRPTATPRVPQHEESGVQVQQLMGASLFCLPESFSGCDESADSTAYAFIQEGGAFWSWTLRPQTSVGIHDLRLELWTLLSVNGQTRPNTVWQYPFSITIGETPVTSDSNPIRSILIVLVGTIGIVAMVVVFYIQKRSTNTPVPKSATGKNPTVFLSYRRKVSWAVALKLHESLSQMGADVFMDMEDLGEGQFANKLMEEIQSRDYFVLLLAPDTLSSEWVMREAQYAMKAGKRIIPVLTDGFQLSEENLPPDLKSISSHNAVTLTLEFYNAGIKRIAKFLGL